ncbi:MAG: rhomboid family intramembrane serine protease [Chloroflexi bacterium]|nr:rhomboid family intramembrane serine protease [Chloroflexota bacterium]
MIPLADGNPTSRPPIVNRLLLLANLAIWLYTFSLTRDPARLQAFYDTYAFDWDTFSAAIGSGRFTFDALIPLVSHMFLHGGWLHVLGNMLYLWIFGDNVEDRLGSGRYLAFYLLCGVAAAIGQGLIAPAPLVGASGAIAGVLGAYLVMFPTQRIRTLIFLGIFITVVQLPALVVIGFWILIQVLSGAAEMRVSASQATEQVAYFAHVIGFISGVLLLLLLRPRRASRLR